jgi:hypothetical protein
MLSFGRLIDERFGNQGYFRAYDMNENEQGEDGKT